MSKMFYGCSSLTYLSLNNFDTRNVKDMSLMFYYCYNLQFLDISSFETNISNIDIINYVANTGTILVNQRFEDKIKSQITNNWKTVITN